MKLKGNNYVFILFQDLALNLRGSPVESKTNIFALDSLFADRIKSYSNKGLNFQSFKNISLSALGSFKQSVLILGN